MLLDPRFLLESPRLIAVTLAVVLIGKPVALAIVRLLKYPFRVAFSVAIALAQIGEFSFILGNIGRSLGVLSVDATNALVAVSIVSIVLNPILYRVVRPLERWTAVRPRLWRLLNPVPIEPAAGAAAVSDPRVDPRTRAVVVGCGPTGRTVTRLLRENGIEPTIVELNVGTVRELRENGLPAVYGDATQRETLEGAGVSNAGSLVLTSAGMGNSEETIRMARELNPGIRVLARAPYLRDLPALRKAGADSVFAGEGEVALALVEAILRRLGATPEQIDRERERAHAELFADAPA